MGTNTKSKSLLDLDELLSFCSPHLHPSHQRRNEALRVSTKGVNKFDYAECDASINKRWKRRVRSLSPDADFDLDQAMKKAAFVSTLPTNTHMEQ
jgi:hypothetical protein